MKLRLTELRGAPREEQVATARGGLPLLPPSLCELIPEPTISCRDYCCAFMR
jgi:hypothetical protein